MLVFLGKLPAGADRSIARTGQEQGLHLFGLPGRFSPPGRGFLRFGMLRWLDRFPLGLLVALALWLAVAPISPAPHLVEKLRLLGRGELVHAIDVLDLLLHSVPLVLLALRLWRSASNRGN
jgi:hypothetical protein